MTSKFQYTRQVMTWAMAAAALAGAPVHAGTAAPRDCRAVLASTPTTVPTPASGAASGTTEPAVAAETAFRQACINQLYRGPISQWPAPQIDAGVHWQELGPRPALPAQPAALVALGEQLFFDPRLSLNRDISCASCHAPHLGFSDGRRVAVGHDAQSGTRNTPHLMGIAFVPQLMWDGRAASLESQALMPIANPIEMAMDLPALEQRLRKETDYPKRFARVFGSTTITQARLGQALAAYERRMEAPRSRFDDFIEGKSSALDEQELRGLHLFRTQARCMNCHSGPLFTQHEFHQIGMSLLGQRLQDLGRQVVTGRSEDMGAMRTPSLRGVSRTAPYFHQGISPSLRGVIDLYNVGMPQPRKPASGQAALPAPSPLIKPLKLSTQEALDLEAFLKTL